MLSRQKRFTFSHHPPPHKIRQHSSSDSFSHSETFVAVGTMKQVVENAFTSDVRSHSPIFPMYLLWRREFTLNCQERSLVLFHFLFLSFGMKKKAESQSPFPHEFPASFQKHYSPFYSILPVPVRTPFSEKIWDERGQRKISISSHVSSTLYDLTLNLQPFAGWTNS